jgi:hypothetical protein
MNWSDLPLKPTPRVLRQFAAAWTVIFLALGLHQALARGHPAAGIIFGAVSVVGLVGLFRPASLRWLFVGATIAAFPVGWLVTQMVLAIMFYLVLTPVALVFRWRGRDALQLRRKPEGASFWTTRSDSPDAGRYLKQF